MLSFLKKIFGTNNNSNRVENSKGGGNSKKEPIKGFPLQGRETEIHIKLVEKQQDYSIDFYFHFPGFEWDYFCTKVVKDEFTKSILIQPKYIHSYSNCKLLLFSENSITFQLGLRSENDSHYLTFGAYQKDINFSLKDKIFLLFDDEEVWEFELSQKGYRFDRDSGGVILETKEMITLEQIKKIESVGLKKWKYLDVKSGNSINGFVELEKKQMILEMAKMQIITLNEYEK